MTRLTGSVEGADRLAATLADAGRTIADLPDDVHRDAGRQALDAAVIPRRTGHLASTAAVVVVAAGFALTATADYAAIVHANDPFFSRAIEAKANAIAGEYLDQITETLNTVQGA